MKSDSMIYFSKIIILENKMSYNSPRMKIYRPLYEIKENFLSLSGTVYGYHDNNICFCRDEKYKNKCIPTSICNDCDINKSGQCPESLDASVPGVS